MTMSQGSKCADSGQLASSVIEFVCDTSIFDTGAPRLVAQLPPGNEDDACAFFFEWRSHVSQHDLTILPADGYFVICTVRVCDISAEWTLGTVHQRRFDVSFLIAHFAIYRIPLLCHVPIFYPYH